MNTSDVILRCVVLCLASAVWRNIDGKPELL